MLDTELLSTIGWQCVAVEPDIDFLSVVSRLGRPVKSRATSSGFIDVLMPRSDERRPSLSRAHGLQAFPLHTDMAYAVKPPRFVCLLAREPNTVATTLVDTADWRLTQEQWMILCNEPWYVVAGRRPFLTSIFQRVASQDVRHAIRYDSQCMSSAVPPRRQRAQSLISEQMGSSRVVKISWSQPSLVVFDNCRILHGREAVSASQENRSIERVCISTAERAA